jgi:hypothetical protein
MDRRAALVPVVALVLLILSPRPAQVGEPPAQPDAPRAAAPAAPLPSVRLEHQLIQVEPARPEKPGVRIRRTIPSTRLASAALDRRDKLVSRARRAFLGDGRFRPEPFPRLER